MAKRMKFSVVGLPHYTIWHLYEPSVDDIRHMEEMDREKKAKEKEEAEKKEREKKVHDTFDTKSNEWEKEKAAIQDAIQKAKNEEKEKAKQGEEPKKQDKVAEQPKKEEKIHEARGEEEKPKAQPPQ
jgi:mannan polymerase II complex ANP1 subunit